METVTQKVEDLLLVEDTNVCCSSRCIIKLPHWKVTLSRIIRKLLKSREFKRQFTALTTNEDRVQFCLGNGTIRRMIEDHLKSCQDVITKSTCGCFKKNNTQAASFHAKGRAEDEEKRYINSLKRFTETLMLTPSRGPSAYAYANRSLVYFALKQYENTIEDIDRAIVTGGILADDVPDLLMSKADCLLRLGCSEEAKKLLETDDPGVPYPETKWTRWELLKKLSMMDNRTLPKRNVNLAKFQDPTAVVDALVARGHFRRHKRFPWLSDKVDLQYDPLKGIYLVATEKIAFSEIIAVAKPYATLIPAEHDAKHERCHYCFTSCFKICDQIDNKQKLPLQVQELPSGPVRIFAPVPCTICPNVIFCSERCRTTAWNAYHQYECGQLALLRQTGDFPHMALRMLYTTGGLEKVRSVVEGVRDDPFDVVQDPQEYSAINGMKVSEVEVDDDDVLKKTVTACFLGKLAQLSGFVQDTPEDAYFTGVTLLRHLFQLNANFLLVAKKSKYRKQPDKHSVDTQYDPLLQVNGFNSLMAHSCDSNVTINFISWGDLIQSNVNIFYSRRIIDPGTELTFNYIKSELYRESLADRQKELLERFGFHCECSKCTCEMRDSIGSAYFPIACGKCSGLMVRLEDDSTKEFHCSAKNCTAKMTTESMKTVFEQVEALRAKLYLYFDAIPAIFQGECRVTEAQLYNQIEVTVESLSKLLYFSSVYLGELYQEMSRFYWEVCLPNSTTKINVSHLRASWEYAVKSLNVFESVAGGSDKDTWYIHELLMIIVVTIGQLIKLAVKDKCQGIDDLLGGYVQFQERLTAMNKLITFDSMLTMPIDDA